MLWVQWNSSASLTPTASASISWLLPWLYNLKWSRTSIRWVPAARSRFSAGLLEEEKKKQQKMMMSDLPLWIIFLLLSGAACARRQRAGADADGNDGDDDDGGAGGDDGAVARARCASRCLGLHSVAALTTRLQVNKVALNLLRALNENQRVDGEREPFN